MCAKIFWFFDGRNIFYFDLKNSSLNLEIPFSDLRRIRADCKIKCN